VVAQLVKQMLSTNVLQRQVVSKSPEQHHAGLIVFVGRIMAICFAFTILAFIYGILFVDQPLEQAPTDAQLIDLLSTLCVFLTGTLSGLVAGNGLKSKPKSEATNETK
jgi:Na+/proline symporter